MIGLLLAAALCAHPHRSRSVVEDFKKLYPCPETCATYTRKTKGHYQLHQRCGACAADHRCPRAWCGKDDTANLQWLGSKENRAKSDDPSQCTYDDVDWDEVDRAIAAAAEAKKPALKKLREQLQAIIQGRTVGP